MSYRPTKLVALKTNARGRLLAESHPNARHSDATVQQAREMRAQGLRFREISAALGVPLYTVKSWCSGHRRNSTPARVIMKRVPL